MAAARENCSGRLFHGIVGRGREDLAGGRQHSAVQRLLRRSSSRLILASSRLAFTGLMR